jgi:ABC-type lipoprotein release transport system permease subunit
VTDGIKVAGVGVVLGIIGAWFASRWVEPLLFNVSARDPATFVGVAAMLVAVAIAASWIPAQRASRVDPNQVLRSE